MFTVEPRDIQQLSRRTVVWKKTQEQGKHCTDTIYQREEEPRSAMQLVARLPRIMTLRTVSRRCIGRTLSSAQKVDCCFVHIAREGLRSMKAGTYSQEFISGDCPSEQGIRVQKRNVLQLSSTSSSAIAERPRYFDSQNCEVKFLSHPLGDLAERQVLYLYPVGKRVIDFI